MVATTPRQTPYVPWYMRWDLPVLVPGVLLALLMVWSVIQSIATSNWADGLDVLIGVALPALLVGVIFARLRWLPGLLAHLLSAALGLAWAIQRIGPLLVHEVSQELGGPMGALSGLIINVGDALQIVLATRMVGRDAAHGHDAGFVAAFEDRTDRLRLQFGLVVGHGDGRQTGRGRHGRFRRRPGGGPCLRNYRSWWSACLR